MKKLFICAGVLLILNLNSSNTSFAASIEIDELIRQKVEMISSNSKIKIDGETVFALYYLPQFYYKNNFNTVWINQGKLNSNANSLIESISAADRDGLNPKDYHLERISGLRSVIEKNTKSYEEFANIEILLTDAYFLMASHMAAGKVNPENVAPEWKAQKRRVTVKLDDHLLNALSNKKIKESISELAPKFETYDKLKHRLKSLMSLKAIGEWPQVAPGLKLEEGQQNDRVQKLRERLEMESYLSVTVENRDVFDNRLKAALQEFQRDHGLLDDGIAGVASIAALNMTIDQKIDQVRINLERCRWLSDDLGDKYIWVNIAAFELQVVEMNKSTFSSKAIVGRTYRKTPIFSATMSYLVFNPYWVIPPGILKNDILPEVRKNTSYLSRKNIKVIDGKGNVVNPGSINWQSSSASSYMFRQEPGKDNALGLVKFMFPNSYSVYIHDTPSKELFENPERAFSSGCIRIQKPLELAAYLLEGQEDWTLDKIHKVTEVPKTPLTVNLSNPLPVHIVYFTSYFDASSGKIRFLKDVYDRDNAVITALKASPPKI